MRVLTVLLIFWCSVVSGQQGFEPEGWFERLPPMAASAVSAYEQLLPKTKKNVYDQYTTAAKAEMRKLYKESGRKSRLLSMFADTYDTEDRNVDVSKISLPVDKELDKKCRELSSGFLRAQDEYARTASRDWDSLRKNVFNPDKALSVGDVEKVLAVEKRAFMPFLQKARKVLSELHAYMESRGYNAVLDGHRAEHPFYVQLLEVRAGIFDRLKMLNETVRGTCLNLALMVEAANKGQ